MALIIGSEDDPHVKAVIAKASSELILVDASTIRSSPVTLTAHKASVGGHELDACRGWIRRLAPEGWADSLSEPGIQAAERSAMVSTLAAIARDEHTTWLTRLDAFGAAENKPLQYRRAARVGVPVPDWMVTTDPGRLPTSGRWVSKPLGRGSFIDDDGTGWVVPTAPVDLAQDPAVLTRVPFILQRQIRASTHARVVTVGSAVHSATLPAKEMPLDWRLSEAAHTGFTDTPTPAAVHGLARVAASALDVGYSAQDWIRDHDGAWWLVDLNPAGQWLFLPPAVAEPVTAAIAAFLDELDR